MITIKLRTTPSSSLVSRARLDEPRDFELRFEEDAFEVVEAPSLSSVPQSLLLSPALRFVEIRSRSTSFASDKALNASVATD